MIPKDCIVESITLSRSADCCTSHKWSWDTDNFYEWQFFAQICGHNDVAAKVR